MLLFIQISAVHFEGFSFYIASSLFVFVLFAILFIVLLPFFYTSARIRRKAEDYKNQRAGLVIAQYDPPRNFTPAEVGYLYDLQCGDKELVATLFHLEQRGIIRLTGTNKADIIDESQYNTLKEYEKIAIRSVNHEFAAKDTPKIVPLTYTVNGGPTQTISFIVPADKSTRAFTNAVKQSLNVQGIPIKNIWWQLSIRAFIFSILLSLLPLLLAGSSSNLNGVPYEPWSATAFGVAVFVSIIIAVFLFPIYFLVGMIMLYLWTTIAGRYWVNTKQARAIWPEIEGYKRYIETVDISKIQFEATDSRRHSIIETLPYAIVFNLDTKWKQLLSKRKTS